MVNGRIRHVAILILITCSDILAAIDCLKPGSQYDADADVDTDDDAEIEINPIPASASVSTSQNTACVKVVSLMLTLS